MRKLKQYNSVVELRTAHDVRKLAACAYCKGFGDRRHMIQPGAKEYVHGRCYAAVHGLSAILKLPKDVTDTLTIGDIGGPVMKALVKKHYGRTRTS